MLKTAVKKIRKFNENKSISLPKKGKSHIKYPIRQDLKPLGKPRPKDRKKELEEIVFGGADDLLEKWNPIESEESEEQHYDNIPSKRKIVWEDEDDKELIVSRNHPKNKICKKSSEYISQLKSNFAKTSGDCSWADLDRKPPKEDSDEDDNLLQRTGDFLTADLALPKKILEFKKCKDLNFESEEKSKITSIQFHPHAQVALISCMNHRLELFQVDGKNNPKIQSLFFASFPISKARFSNNGEEVILLSRLHGYFYYFDMIAGKISRIPKSKDPDASHSLSLIEVSPDGRLIVMGGRFGNIHLLTANTKECIDTLKMNSEVKAFDFNVDGSILYSHGVDGEVYIWDINSRSLRHKFYDEGCIRGTAIASSPNNQYLACGSDSGVVNIYNASSCEKSQSPKPLKAVFNLTTKISNIKFNATSEMLAFISGEKGTAAKLLHCQSMTVFSNFPPLNERLMIPTTLDFSKNSGYFSLGNNKGNAFLYRLKHYNNF